MTYSHLFKFIVMKLGYTYHVRVCFTGRPGPRTTQLVVNWHRIIKLALCFICRGARRSLVTREVIDSPTVTVLLYCIFSHQPHEARYCTSMCTRLHNLHSVACALLTWRHVIVQCVFAVMVMIACGGVTVSEVIISL